MAYIIGRQLDYTKIYLGTCIDEVNNITKTILKIEYGVNWNEEPTIFTNKDEAFKIMKEIRDKKDEIIFEDVSIFKDVCNNLNQFDVSQLKVWSLFKFDAEKDIKEQMKSMLK